LIERGIGMRKLSAEFPKVRRVPNECSFGKSGGFAFLGIPARGGKTEESAAGETKETACEASSVTTEEC
jgi:hypothetical protein